MARKKREVRNLMALFHSPRSASDGLVMCLDAANPKSNKSVGTGWYNLAGGWDYVSQSSSPSLGTRGGAQCMVFDGLGERFQSSPSGFQSPSVYMTMEAWIYPEANLSGSTDRMNIFRANSGGTRAYLSLNNSNNRLSNYWYGGSPSNGYHETVSFAPGRNVWQHFCATWDGSTLRQYVNYENKGSVAFNSSACTFGTEIQIGWEGNGRQFSGGIALIRQYNRALSDAEVRDNFHSTRQRFGI